ncbi:MAG: sodium:proton antiporter [Candidatus Competibacteraceae bacterium]|jgi:CPA1 family monovalent cation:H+ antiporter|nr:sodium:proton antiporter [Candidatus Competibacteraceae bacterium]
MAFAKAQVICEHRGTSLRTNLTRTLLIHVTEHLALLIALIGLLGISAQWLAWRLQVPAILFLLLIGLVAGPMTNLIRPDELFGDLLFPLVSLGVAVILFEGSLTLRLEEIKGHGNVVTHLVTIGVFVTWLSTGIITWWLLDISAEIAFLFGAVVTVTGPTVIVPLLRSVRPVASVANILRWEGILVDPIGALLAVLMFEFIVSGQQEGHTAWLFAKALLVGGGAGAGAALLLAHVLRHHLLPDYLHNVATLVWVLSVFALANTLQHESGLLAVTVMGMLLANLRQVQTDEILGFKESLSLLIIALLFIVLAARVELAQLLTLGPQALLVLLALMVLVRPLVVIICSAGAGLSWREKTLLAWIGPRGIVAAAVSAVFALQLESKGYPEAPLLVSLTFMVIMGTVVIQSATARPLAHWLGVTEPEPRGILVVGGNRVAQAIATALAEQGFSVLIADNDWQHIRAARMKNMATYFGHIVSQHADQHLDLVGIGRLFALSRQPSLNALACVRYRTEFGTGNVFFLTAPEEETAVRSDKRSVTPRLNGRRLFGTAVTFNCLATLLDDGAEIRATPLTETFDFNAYLQRYGGDVIPLFAVDDKDQLRIFTDEQTITLNPGWRIIALIPNKALGDTAKNG